MRNADPAPATAGTSKSWVVIILVVLVTLLAAYLRLAGLEEGSLRADTINFWSVCRAPLGALDIWGKWRELNLDHPGLTLLLTKALIDTFKLPVTVGTLTIVPALFGIACIPVMFLVGRRMGGPAFGVVLAAMMALNPIHIQVSREPYHYSLLILGSCLMLLATLETILSVRDRKDPGAGFYVALFLGALGLTLSTFTGWLVAFVEGLTILGALAWRWRKEVVPPRTLIWALIFLAAVAVPNLLAPWGFSHLVGKLGAAQKAASLSSLVAADLSVKHFLWGVVTSFGWGRTPVRAIFTIVVMLSAALVILLDRERRMACAACVVLLVLNIGLYMVTRQALGTWLEARYVVGLLPIWLVLLGAGLWFPHAKGKLGIVLRSALTAAAVLFYAEPALAAKGLTGQPVPYRGVQAWFDSHLPKGTLVLVDRWLDPWNELRVYSSTNVVFTFTIPNEPVDVYLKYNWRKTAEQFFEKFPDAAYLEIFKSYWNVPTVGPWQWPRDFFRQHVVITNAAGLKLWELGLQNRQEGRHRNLIEIFYNTRDDVLAKAREAGRSTLVLYGTEWGYTKLWQQYNDFRDWRVLNDRASLDAYNLTDASVTGRLKVRGLAAGGSKRVKLGDQPEFVFPGGQMAEWNAGPLTLAPGLTRLEIADTLFDRTRVLLLVEAVSFELRPVP